ncbi:MAG: MarR family winged helix-turn-helix transcriptional regulator [Paracoccaceae bacterium]|jgi:DNA-binding MarR family transcriptional regulator|nr:MarR family winged helix-turn-helix transcriptional regulator [Paracoccaceae bacterium]MDG1370002.1 MarR family winged helix-turn-helix transcriptional regulator [Paracoccaceae bacterium]
MHAFDLDAFLPYRLAKLASRVSRGFSQEYSTSFGLSIPEWRVMAHLSQSDTVSVRELHLKADLEKSKASRAAARLQAAGLVVKKTSETDRRLIELSLTPRGEEMIGKLRPLALSYEADVLSALSPEDRTQLDRLIDKLLQNT